MKKQNGEQEHRDVNASCSCEKTQMHSHEETCSCHGDRRDDHGHHHHSHEHHHAETCSCHGEHCHDHGHHHAHEHHHEETCSCRGEHHHEAGGCCCCEEGIERLERKEIFLYIIGAVILVLAFLPMLPGMFRLISSAVVYMIFGFSVWREMIEGFGHKKIFTEFTLMCTASVGAVILGEYADAAAVMYLYALGETISGLASGKARRNIAELISVTPEHATVLGEEGTEVRNPADVRIGDVILVRAGERIPLDGVVRTGGGAADTSSITGEQIPVELSAGERCLSGSLLISGSVEIEATHSYENSVAVRLKAAVADASERKAVTEKRITRLAAVVTPVAFVIGLLIFGVGALATGDISEWFRRGLVILVCSCPCSLILSIPLTYFAGIGSAAGRGIVFRGGEVVDNMAKLDAVLFDKTGTLTETALRYDRLVIAEGCGCDEAEIRRLAYAALLHSPHVAAQAYCRAHQDAPSEIEWKQIENIPGKGICVRSEDVCFYGGNARLMADIGIQVVPNGKTSIYLAMNGTLLGHLEFSSCVKKTAPEAIAQLRAAGVGRLAILSGDIEPAVAEVAQAVGIEEYYAAQLPEEKLKTFERVYEHQKKCSKGAVAFCGDGLNDSAVIAASDIGIAMGRGGSAVTVEAADVVLMDDAPEKLPLAVRLSKRTVRIVNQNICISFAMKIGIALICVVVVPSMEFALIADVGAAVISVLNAMRAGKKIT